MGHPKDKSRSQKRKFIGIRFTERTKPLDVSTVSEQKLNTISVFSENIPSKDDKMSGNRIVDVKILHNVFSCFCCPSCLTVNLQLTEDSNIWFIFWTCEKVLNVASVVSNNVRTEAADEVRKLKNTSSDVAECGVSVDGTLQRRVHSLLNGCVNVLSIDIGQVLDLELMSKWCIICNTSKGPGKRYIQKRVDSKLRILKTKEKGLMGKGKLSDSLIDEIQNYYGIAIGSNISDLKEIKRAVIAAFYHCCSSKSNPMHG
ncbi:uncharacterized protein TNCV_2873001 [Trichonephila clavipes]|nr:uncharacterized protein TNCV_2873001 [Trichonephila clavipes]